MDGWQISLFPPSTRIFLLLLPFPSFKSSCTFCHHLTDFSLSSPLLFTKLERGPFRSFTVYLLFSKRGARFFFFFLFGGFLIYVSFFFRFVLEALRDRSCCTRETQASYYYNFGLVCLSLSTVFFFSYLPLARLFSFFSRPGAEEQKIRSTGPSRSRFHLASPLRAHFGPARLSCPGWVAHPQSWPFARPLRLIERNETPARTLKSEFLTVYTESYCRCQKTT